MMLAISLRWPRFSRSSPAMIPPRQSTSPRPSGRPCCAAISPGLCLNLIVPEIVDFYGVHRASDASSGG